MKKSISQLFTLQCLRKLANQLLFCKRLFFNKNFNIIIPLYFNNIIPIYLNGEAHVITHNGDK